MGIRASYLVTGGIMTVLGLALARLLLGVLGTAAAGLVGFLLAAGAFVLKATLIVLAVWVVVRLVRGRRRRRAAES